MMNLLVISLSFLLSNIASAQILDLNQSVPKESLEQTLLRLVDIFSQENENTADKKSNNEGLSEVIGTVFGSEIKTPISKDNVITTVDAHTSSSLCKRFSRSFVIGNVHKDIIDIQKFLNSDSETLVAVSGPGSKTLETEIFGLNTFFAVMKFQKKYADKILLPIGLSGPTGIWGPSTRAQAEFLSGCSREKTKTSIF